jgi:transposase
MVGYFEGTLSERGRSGIETPMREIAKLDRKRTEKGNNEDWKHPRDSDARITKMKDGRTHLAQKAEHAVDMGTGTIVAVTLHGVEEATIGRVTQPAAFLAQGHCVGWY